MSRRREHVVRVVLTRWHKALKGAVGLIPGHTPARRHGGQLSVRGLAGAEARTGGAQCDACDHAPTDPNELSALHGTASRYWRIAQGCPKPHSGHLAI